MFRVYTLREGQAAMSEAPAMVKISASVSEDTLGALRDLAFRRGTTVTEALRRAIVLDSYLAVQESEGAKLLLEDSNRKIVRIIRK